MTGQLGYRHTFCQNVMSAMGEIKLLLTRRSGKLQKATVSFIISACPSSWNNSTPTGRILIKRDMSIVRKPVEKIQVSLKSDRNNGYYT